MVVNGIKGNEWAWQNGQYESVEHFREVQAKWTKWGVVLWVASFALSMLVTVLAFIIAAANR